MDMKEREKRWKIKVALAVALMFGGAILTWLLHFSPGILAFFAGFVWFMTLIF